MQEARHIVTYHYRVVRPTPQEEPCIMSLNNYRLLVQYFYVLGLAKPELIRNGGATVSVVKNDINRRYYIGFTICNDTDMYDKAYGVKESIKRAVRAARKGQKFSAISKSEDLSEKIINVLDVISTDMPLRFLYDNDKLSNEAGTLSPVGLLGVSNFITL